METKAQKTNSNLFLCIGILFVTCLLIANIGAFKLFTIGPLVLTAGVLVFPITYIINDLLTEVYGYEKAKKVIFMGFAMNLLMVIYFQIAIHLPAPVFFEGQEAFGLVLGNTLRALIASLAAYLVGSLINAKILSKMKVKTKGKYLMARVVISTLAGEFLDSVIFVTILFSFTMDWKSLIIMIFTQSIVKTLYEIVIYPITKIVIKKVKEHEGLDVYDTDELMEK